MKQEFSGKCLCGSVTYTAVGPPIIVAQCHCEECRRLSGTGHSVGAMFLSTNVTLVGNVRKFTYSSSKDSEVTKAVCATCASPIFGANTRMPDYLTLTLGTMDEAKDLAVSVVIFERDRPHWDQLGADAARFDTQPDWTPGS